MRSGVWYSGVQEDQVIKRLVGCMWCDREGLFIISLKMQEKVTCALREIENMCGYIYASC
jgi:hypothetical protein